MIDTKRSPRRRRRTQAERTADSRARLIKAAVAVLRRHGYSGATVQAIAKEAGVTVGGLQHQFPTKHILMAAVLEAFGAERIAAYHAAVGEARSEKTKVERLVDATWANAKQPNFAAMMEVDLARRSDPELDLVARPVLAAIDDQLFRWAALLLRRAGGIDTEAFRVVRLLNNSMLKGLAMELATGRPSADVERSWVIWRSVVLAKMLYEG